MTNITLQKQHRTLWHFIPGLALSAVITGVALWGGSIPAVAGAGFSALTLAILLGMVLGNTIYPHIWKSCDGGVLFAKQYLLRLGIILYGFRLTFSQIADVGISGIIIDVLTLSSTFLLACFLGQKVFGLDKHTSWLIGAGSSICGAAAVLATEPVVKAEASKVTVAVATVVIFGTIAIFLYPAIYPLMSQWFSPETFGIYIGSTVHEVAQVVAAGHAISPFMGGLLLNPLEENGNDSGLTGARCSGLCDDALNHIVNRTTTNNQPGKQNQCHQQRFRPGFFQRADVSGQTQRRHRHCQQEGIQRYQHVHHALR